MKRLSIVLVPLLGLSLALAACGPAAQEQPGPAGVDQYGAPTTELEQPGGMETPAAGATQPGQSISPSLQMTEPAVGETPEASEPPVGQAPEATEPGLAVSPTLEATEPPVGEAPSQGGGQEEAIPSTGAVQANRVSNLMDFEVWNTGQEQLGNVQALVIDMHASQVKYVVIGSGGVLGLGQSLIPVPYDVLQLRTTAEAGAGQPSNTFVLDASADELKQAPTIESLDVIGAQAAAATEGQTQQPASQPFAEREQEILSFWGSRMGATAGQTGQQQSNSSQAGQEMLVLAQDLLGARVQAEGAAQPAPDGDRPGEMNGQQPDAADQQGQSGAYAQPATPEAASAPGLGEVQDITIDYTTGQVRYVLISAGADVLASGQGMIAGNQGQATGDQGQSAGVQQPVSPEVQTAGEELLPVPLSALSWNAQDRTLSYTGSQSLQEAPTITPDEFQMGGWESKIDAFWGNAANSQPAN